MPGANCSIVGCTTSRSKKNKGITIFRVTRGKDEWSVDWRKRLVKAITKDRILDDNLRRQIKEQTLHICQLHFTNMKGLIFYLPSQTLHICQLHFTEDLLYYGKYIYIFELSNQCQGNRLTLRKAGK